MFTIVDSFGLFVGALGLIALAVSSVGMLGR